VSSRLALFTEFQDSQGLHRENLTQKKKKKKRKEKKRKKRKKKRQQTTNKTKQNKMYQYLSLSPYQTPSFPLRIKGSPIPCISNRNIHPFPLKALSRCSHKHKSTEALLPGGE
jgi:CRISPR/Cas system CSM-associated protein Csm5 (group 7 of RAMP superfamily)